MSSGWVLGRYPVRPRRATDCAGSAGTSRQGIPPQEVNRRLLEVGLQDLDHVTLDIDASVVHAKKKTARPPTRANGDTPLRAHCRVDQIAHCEMCKGNVPPTVRNVEFFQRCIKALPEGVRVSRFRVDAASYQVEVINFCRRHGIRFAIRVGGDPAVKAAIASAPEDAWQPMRLADGPLSETGFVPRTVHVMADIPALDAVETLLSDMLSLQGFAVRSIIAARFDTPETAVIAGLFDYHNPAAPVAVRRLTMAATSEA